MRQILLLFFLMPFIFYPQVQIGDDIDGDIPNGEFGSSISLSSDGLKIAISSLVSNTINGINSGFVRIYNYNGNEWIKIGDDINGEAPDDYSGRSVSLSSDGTVVAIGTNTNEGVNGENSGHVRVYNYNELNGWEQLGNDIDGEALNDYSGWSVSLSSDGTVVAIGAPSNSDNGMSSGHVRVYNYNELNGWEQLGSDIDGEEGSNIPIDFNGDGSGSSVSLSSDGTVVAIGAYRNDGNGDRSGHVRVYSYTALNGWEQLGSDIDGEAADDNSGFSISLSSDGAVLAVGAPFNDGNGDGSGHVRIFNYYGGAWIQIGDDIDGEAGTDISGRSVSLSADGTIIAIGAPRNKGNNINFSGHVRIFKNISNVWTQIGNDINAENEDDRLGHTVSLSSDGSILAVGALLNDGNGLNTGHVRVYDLKAVLSTESFNKDYFTMYPNPVNDILNIEINKGLELKQVNIYNVLSQYLYTIKESKIDTNNLESGIYFIEIVTDKGKSAKKVIID